ncbi:MAG: septum formation initiator family protein [Myxococcota bacterium]
MGASLNLTRKQVLLLGVVASLLVVATAVLSPQGLAQYRRLSNEAEGLRKQNAELRLENERKRAEVEALKNSRRYQEKVVREDLGYVNPGEKLFIVEGVGEAKTPPAQTVLR